MQLGVIEGFYGPLWDGSERSAVAHTLADHGYGFWHYAPKADPCIRNEWRLCWDDDRAAALRAFARDCHALGLRFGIGISPLGLRDDAPAADWHALARRLAELDAIGIDELVIAFDDIRGDTPDLARQQAAITEWAAARTRADRIIICPTYYSDDPLLDRLFGARPPDYLAELGRSLDPRIGVYWTGEEVCAREVSVGHMTRVGETLRRKPLLWDNYPVNDSPRMARYLHLRPFTARPARLAEVVDGHAINPALQPALSTLPALTLATSYRLREGYEYMAAFRAAAREVLGVPLAAEVEADLAALADTGLDRLDAYRDELRARYAGFDHPAAREIVRWLDGGYRPEQAAPANAD